MGNTHTKLLAGAFSVLSVLQLFMVSDLANQVNLYTENVTASMVAATPMNSMLRTRAKTLPYDARTKAKIMQQMHNSAPSRSERLVKPTHLKTVTGPNGRTVRVIDTRPSTTHTGTDAQ